MQVTSNDRDWFSQYCLQCAANVLNKDGELRFDYTTLHDALTAVESGNDGQVPLPVVELFRNIVNLCNKRCKMQQFTDNEEHALLLTLLNIQAAFYMVCGAWRETTLKSGDVDEYGFEIF